MSGTLERILKRMARRALKTRGPGESRAPSVKAKPRTPAPVAPPLTETEPNRLAGETSPYLLQHAFNPVDWYPWGEEALARA